MPCYDSGPSKEYLRLCEIKDDLRKATAVVCALYNEISRREDANAIVLAATKKGEVDVGGFIKEHIKDDEERLGLDLSKYSLDELGTIQRLIDESLRI